MKASYSTVPKKVVRTSKKVLKTPTMVMNMPKDIIKMSLEMVAELVTTSIDILDDPTKIAQIPKQLINMPTRAINKLVKTYFSVYADFKDNDFMDQESILIDLLRRCRDTAFGRRYGFDYIKTIQDFQNNVPLFHYNDFEPWVHYMLKGEENVTYPGKTDWFATSSGTSEGTSKYLPVTADGLKKCHFKGGIDVLTYYIKNNPKSRVLDGKGLMIGGTRNVNPYTGEKNVGFISAILQKNSPWIAKLLREPGDDIAYIENREDKLDAVVKHTVGKNITSLSGTPGWILSLLYKVLEYTGKENISEVRPHLELFYRGGLPITLYKEQFEKLIPNPKMKYYQVYNASEGFFSIQDRNDVDDMLLLTNHGTFYEFIELEEYGKDNPKVLTLQEVEVDKEYVIVITNYSGLRRYILGDVIVFTECDPRRIKITGRTKYFINMLGERVFLNHIEKAMLETCKKTDAMVAEYTVGPLVYEGGDYVGVHERAIEFIQQPKDLAYFTEVLDQEMGLVNQLYRDERHDTKVLGFPIVHAVETGTFYQWMKTNNKLGGQHKIPKLRNDRKLLDELLSIAESSTP